MRKELSPIYWLWIPIIGMVIQIILEITLSKETLSNLLSENGPHELLQCLVIFIAFLVSCSYFLTIKNKTPLLNFWFAMAALCCLYVAGEELSWGQQILNWGTPEYWTQINDQAETNLHNTSSWLDQKPRLILLLGITVGTLLIVPLYKRGIIKLREDLAFLLPSSQLSLIALLIVVPQLVEKIFESFNISIFARFSEVQELYMFYFVLLYLLVLKAKLRTV